MAITASTAIPGWKVDAPTAFAFEAIVLFIHSLKLEIRVYTSGFAETIQLLCRIKIPCKKPLHTKGFPKSPWK